MARRRAPAILLRMLGCVRRPTLRWLAAVVWLGLLGCEGHALLAADAPSDAGPPALTLRFALDGPVGLPFGTTTPLEVRLSGPGGPAAGETVSFALDGSAGASSLTGLAATTDAEGIARVSLMAGDRPASYRVRANHPLAAAVWLEVNVAASFGRVVVRPVHEGEPVERWSVGLFVGADCARASEAAEALRRRDVAADAGAEARFDALPTEATYTIVVHGLAGERNVERGCVPGVGVLADAETVVSVPMSPAPRSLVGRYAATLSFALDPGSVALLADWIRGASERAGGAEADAARALAALSAALSEDPAALAALERLGPAPLEGGLLATAAPSAELPVLLASAAAELAALDVVAELEVSEGDVLAMRPEGLVAAGGASPLDLRGVPLEPVLVAATYDPDRAVLVLDRLAVPLPLGAALVAVLDARARALGLSDRGGLVGGEACAPLGAFLELDAALAAACGAACREAACAAMASGTLDAALADVASLDRARAQGELSGALAGRDVDRDLRVDLLDGVLSGTYGPEGGPGDPVEVRFAASRTSG